MKSFKHVRLAVAVVVIASGAMGGMIASQRTGAAMAKSAQAFLDSLTPEQREKAGDPLDSTDRTRWHFIPTNQFPRQGLPLKEMTEPQRKLALQLLQAGLSQRGYTVTATIMNDLEAILRDTEAAARAAKPNPNQGQGQIRDPELYFFTVFGTPGNKGQWGWRVEGHHLSLHFTIANGSAVVAAPTFWGTNPAEVREGPKKGLRDARQGAGRRPRADDGARRCAEEDGDVRGSRAERHPHDKQGDRRSAEPARRCGIRIDREAARAADAADRRLHGSDDARHRRGAEGGIREGRRREDRVRVGRPGRAGRTSTTTACRARRSSSSSTTRRTTATTCTRCGATSTATSAAICCASTWRR